MKSNLFLGGLGLKNLNPKISRHNFPTEFQLKYSSARRWVGNFCADVAIGYSNWVIHWT